MDFIDRLKQLAQKAEAIKGNLTTEEATKTSLIMPFFNLLGYDVFNPEEFVPEYTADVGIKKGEKVDYAIMQNGKPIILVEAKWVGDNLKKHDSQLFRYFTVTEAKFAILTNGIVYRFYTDLEETNKMDNAPFLEVNILDLKDSDVQELKKFGKENFDIDTIFNTASELKYTNIIKNNMAQQLSNPSDDFVRLAISEFYTGVKTQNVIEKFRPIVKKSLHQFINEFMNDKIKSILSNDSNEETAVDNVKPMGTQQEVEDDIQEVEADETKIVTTEEEIEGYYIVRSILSELTNPEDITRKDVERYFGILYKNNTRKWLCRLYFNGTKKSITIPDENKNEVRYYIENLNDIYKYKVQLLDSLRRHMDTK